MKPLLTWPGRPGALLASALLLTACASKAPAPAAPSAAAAPAPLANAAPADTASTGKPAAPGARSNAPREVRTRNAVFKLANYDDLPGWQQDDMRAGWSAFRNSCDVLQKRDDWREICAASRDVAPTTRAMRGFFESRFTLLRILNTDANPQGEVTGYFEPLLEGQMQRDGEFNVPVLGVPRDLYTMDWTRVPKDQRAGVVRVRIDGNLLMPMPAGSPGGYAMDLRRFELDDRDRRLRARLVGEPGTPGGRVDPYYTRAELESRGLPAGVDAPVVVWVNDALALYAMQVQGSGRVRLPDGSILRLQYAEQNGHPFRPLRVVPKATQRVATRGAGGAAEEADAFTFEDDAAAPPDAAEATDDAPVLTRGGAVPAAPRRQAEKAPDPLVDELLKGARKPAPAKPVAAVAARPAAKPPARATNSRLITDPSYVFFKPVTARPATEGPQGALGVPLTPGRSVAVDPRVTPLGYPVFLSAPAPKGSTISMQRLVFAQDTGGAIRGAVRADYFWGFGNEAGQMARSTRHRGQMWVMLPNAEASRLSSSKLVTRGGGAAPADSDGSCLVPDGEFCAEVD